MIQSKLYSYLGILLEGRERFEEESLIEKRKRHVIDQPGTSGTLKIDVSLFPSPLSLYEWIFLSTSFI